MKGVKGNEAKEGWGQPNAFGLYSRGNEEPPKTASKLDAVKAMPKNPRWTRDCPPLWGRGCKPPLSDGRPSTKPTKPQASGCLGLWKESSNTDASSSIGRG